MDETKKDPIYLPPGGFNFQHCFYREYLMQFSNRLDALEALTPKRSSSDSHYHIFASKIHSLALKWVRDNSLDADRVFVDNVRCAIYPNGLDEPK